VLVVIRSMGSVRVKINQHVLDLDFVLVS
jgi:hypothetical protein